jgi:hypothetical protein
MSNTEKFTLITNMKYVKYQGVSINCSSLLITKREGLRDFVRGFGVESSDAVFHYTTEDNNFQFNITIAEKDEYQNSCYYLSFTCGLEVCIVASQPDKRLDIEEYEGDICQVWRRLPLKVAKYWSGSHIPLARWVRIEDMWLSESLSGEGTNR